LRGVVLTNNLSHLTKGLCSTSLELGSSIDISVLESWEHQVTNFLCGKILQAIRDVQDSGMLHLSFIIIQKKGESLNKVIVSDLFSERVSESSKVFGKSKSNLPGFVLSSSQKSSKGMDLVLFL